LREQAGQYAANPVGVDDDVLERERVRDQHFPLTNIRSWYKDGD
jgi:hypothetical protein